jgi:sortase A
MGARAALRGGPVVRAAGTDRARTTATADASAARSCPGESSPQRGGRARRLAWWAAVALPAVAGAGSLGGGVYLDAKAFAGQWLLQRAWSHTAATGAPAKPWPWADTHPVARLTAPAHGVDLLVLAGASGRTLAWGPGWLDDSAAPGTPGNTVLAAHRDTHFRFLADVRRGERLTLERPGGGRSRYRVRETAIVDARALALPREVASPTLTLVTCWPFDAIVPGGPLRYVVVAEAE